MCSSHVVIAMVVAVVIVEAIASIIGSLIVVFTNESQQEGLANTTETISDNHAHHRSSFCWLVAAMEKYISSTGRLILLLLSKSCYRESSMMHTGSALSVKQV